MWWEEHTRRLTNSRDGKKEKMSSELLWMLFHREASLVVESRTQTKVVFITKKEKNEGKSKPLVGSAYSFRHESQMAVFYFFCDEWRSSSCIIHLCNSNDTAIYLTSLRWRANGKKKKERKCERGKKWNGERTILSVS